MKMIGYWKKLLISEMKYLSRVAEKNEIIGFIVFLGIISIGCILFGSILLMLVVFPLVSIPLLIIGFLIYISKQIKKEKRKEQRIKCRVCSTEGSVDADWKDGLCSNCYVQIEQSV